MTSEGVVLIDLDEPAIGGKWLRKGLLFNQAEAEDCTLGEVESPRGGGYDIVGQNRELRKIGGCEAFGGRGVTP